MPSANEYTCPKSSLRQDLQSWLTTHTKTKQKRQNQLSELIKLINHADLPWYNTARDWINSFCSVTKHYHRSSGHGWGLVCGTPWLPKWHSQLGLSLTRRQSHSSLAVFCRTAWGSSSALFDCLSVPGKGSNGQSPPGSSLIHRESMYLSSTQKNTALEHHLAAEVNK